MIRFLHGADFHLDSAFGALDQRRSAARRRESRETALRLSNYVNSQGVDLVLLAGDLFDSAAAFRETGEQLSAALGQVEAQVFIAPGNHDWYGPGSPWRTVDWPENVHIFSENALTAVELPEWNLVVHGAAFTGPEQAESALRGFTAPDDGKVHLLLVKSPGRDNLLNRARIFFPLFRAFFLGFGKETERGSVVFRSVKDLDITLSSPAVFDVDGDSETFDGTLRVRVTKPESKVYIGDFDILTR